MEKSIQRKAFNDQLSIANETGVPLVIHCRDAETEVLEIMKEVTHIKSYLYL